MIISLVVILFGLLIVKSIVVPAGSLGKFERERRNTTKKDIEVERELYYGDILTIQHVTEALLLVGVSALSVAALGWVVGVLLALFIGLEYGALASFKPLRSVSYRLYRKIELRILHFVESYPGVMKFIRIFTPEATDIHLHSRAELEHLIDQSVGVVEKTEKKRLLASLQFSNKLVQDVMTPRSMIDAVNKTEVLGPLVLDDLHKKGHSRFPAIETDVDHVVGMLHLRDVVAVDGTKRHTQKVESAMEQRVFYIQEKQTLEHALTAFIRTHHHLFIVVNEYRETVGLVSLEDVTEALIGQAIIDEFDAHDDLRAVAARNPNHFNKSEYSRDV